MNGLIGRLLTAAGAGLGRLPLILGVLSIPCLSTVVHQLPCLDARPSFAPCLPDKQGWGYYNSEQLGIGVTWTQVGR